MAAESMNCKSTSSKQTFCYSHPWNPDYEYFILLCISNRHCK